ncbi:lytic transglycosylase domain-containing protein [Mesorhizobium sp. 1B3]|uniref:lytic transglycosylase domain-containing protein n=1 Tax=Mesorhizobium sp. 1B3 TaxID=3243599 RepID=UPI003D96D6AD
MRKIAIVAAALAAGLMTFAAHTQAAPAPASTEKSSKNTAKGKAAPSKPKTAKAKKGSTKSAKKSSKAEKSTVGFPLGNLAGLKKSVDAPKSKPQAGPIMGGDYHDIIHRYATSYGIPLSLAHAVVRVESNYRANARGKAGEIGLMQIKPATARMMGYSGSTKGLFDPETNIKYGMLYLAKAQKLGGGALCQTILKYNAGHAAKRMNPVSAAYCAKVKRLSTGL